PTATPRSTTSSAAGHPAPLPWPAWQRPSWWRCTSPSTSSSTCPAGRFSDGCAHEPPGRSQGEFRRAQHGGCLMSTAGGAHHPESVSVAAERRWLYIVAAITFALVAMMVITGLHWAAMPPSRVETVDPRTLHVSGEFVESNLGTAVGADGRVVVRLV